MIIIVNVTTKWIESIAVSSMFKNLVRWGRGLFFTWVQHSSVILEMWIKQRMRLLVSSSQPNIYFHGCPHALIIRPRLMRGFFWLYCENLCLFRYCILVKIYSENSVPIGTLYFSIGYKCFPFSQVSNRFYRSVDDGQYDCRPTDKQLNEYSHEARTLMP